MKLAILTGLLAVIIGMAACVPTDLDIHGGIELTEDSTSS